MEASQASVKFRENEVKSIYITPIANIRTELKLFNAIFYLDRSPFKDLILKPSSYMEPSIPNQVPNLHYSGYVNLPMK